MGKEVPPLGDNFGDREGPGAPAGVGGDADTWASYSVTELAKIRFICLPLFHSFKRRHLYLPNGSHDHPNGSGNHPASQ